MRIAAILLAAAVLFVMLNSALFIAAEADHDCAGEHCRICFQLRVCHNALKTLSLAASAAALAVTLSYTLCCSVFACAAASPSNTLVSLKVKLTD